MILSRRNIRFFTAGFSLCLILALTFLALASIAQICIDIDMLGEDFPQALTQEFSSSISALVPTQTAERITKISEVYNEWLSPIQFRYLHVMVKSGMALLGFQMQTLPIHKNSSSTP